jgi:hypothetical protein
MRAVLRGAWPGRQLWDKNVGEHLETGQDRVFARADIDPDGPGEFAVDKCGGNPGVWRLVVPWIVKPVALAFLQETYLPIGFEPKAESGFAIAGFGRDAMLHSFQ